MFEERELSISPLVVTCDPGVVSPLQAAVLEASLACDNLPCDALGR